jgi:DNA-binding Lrp family transcriptional regulator
MKYKYLFLILALVASVSLFGVAQAQNSDNDDRGRDNQSTSSIQDDDRDDNKYDDNEDGEEIKDDRASSTKDDSDDENDDSNNEDDKNMSENHRSAVANFVQSLLKVADREGGIGEEVREVAKSQNDSATTTVSAMKKVEERGAVRKFLFGSDYKNLGVIRSELATTTQNIAKLKLAVDKVVFEADRLELNTQIENLETELAKINTYLKAHEDVFSLFGWFNKIINQ